MSSPRLKCIIILSSKSAGSSVLQNLLTKHGHTGHVSKTRHSENETLYWVKAASVLGLPQVAMADSEIPIPPAEARTDLIQLLADNLGPSCVLPKDDRELIFDGWHQLCRHYAPVFLEKSPHHLHQWSALELIMQCMRELPEVGFLFVGLVRNPMDTLYSMWRRWRVIPEHSQYDWLVAYSNLLKLRELLGAQVVTIRYEDMVTDSDCLGEVFRFIGVANPGNRELHRRSLGIWRRKKLYGFQLAGEVATLAEQYGYDRRDLHNDTYALWPVYRRASRWFRHSLRPITPTLGRWKRQLRGVGG